jgi:hypothetical protein
MSSLLYMLEALLDCSQITVVSTGHVAPVMAWEDTPNGRRMGSTPELDPESLAPLQVADLLLPFGRDGKPELFGVRFASHEVPKLDPYMPAEVVGLRVRVKRPKEGKGIEVAFTADMVRPAGGPQRQTRRPAEGEAA